MSAGESNIHDFAALVRQLLSKHKALKKENAELYSMVDERDKTIEELKRQLKERDDKYNALMTAKVINIADQDLETSRKRVQQLIRSVNQCITLISNKE